MFFKTQKVLHELDVDFRDEQPIEFIFTRPHPAAVSVRKASAEEQQLSYKKDTLLCAVTIDLNVSQEPTACAKPRRQTGQPISLSGVVSVDASVRVSSRGS